MRAKLTTTQARQATGQRSTFWVLIVSLILAVIAGLILGLAFGWIPIPWSASAWTTPRGSDTYIAHGRAAFPPGG